MKQGNSRGQPRKRGRKSKVQKALQAQRLQSEQKQLSHEEVEAVPPTQKTKKIHHNTLKAMERKKKAEEERLRKLEENRGQVGQKEQGKAVVTKQKKRRKKNQNVEEGSAKSKEENAKVEAQVQSQPPSQLPLLNEPLHQTMQSESERKLSLPTKNLQSQHPTTNNRIQDDIFDVLKPFNEVNDQLFNVEDRSSVYNDFLLGKIRKNCTVPECDVFNDP